MNKARRNRIHVLVNALSEAKAELESVIDDEQEALDAMPDSLREAERGTNMEVGLDLLTQAKDELESVIDALEEALDPPH